MIHANTVFESAPFIVAEAAGNQGPIDLCLHWQHERRRPVCLGYTSTLVGAEATCRVPETLHLSSSPVYLISVQDL